MSRNSTIKKKSTSKYRKFKVSPLIPVLALLEAVILIGISTFAWFVVSQEKEANTGIITVDADSGLDIDFKNANYDDEINIWDYVEDDFKFEPVTSLDGRNIFIPTSGTFDKSDTNTITFREATVNDINTKYLNVDFMLTNTTNGNMDVFLSNDSVFKVWDGASQQNSRALRLAFYKNDGNHGKVDSSILANTQSENIALDQLSNKVTVYFEKPSHWSTVYAYMWKNSSDYAVSWPGSIMTRLAGQVYSYTFDNTAGYTNIIFSNGEKDNIKRYGDSGVTASNATQTRDLTITNGNEYFLRSGDTGYPLAGSAYSTKTVYFIKPSGWSTVYAHAFKAAGESTSFTSWPGDECTYVGADVYSYTFPTTYNSNTMGGIVFNNNSNSKTNDLTATDGELYYFTSDGSGKSFSDTNNSASSGACNSTNYILGTVYFYNARGFSSPYAKVKAANGHVAHVPMTNLSSGVYYAKIPLNFYTQVAFEDGANQTTNTKYTQYGTITDGYMYRPNAGTPTGYTLTNYSYSDYAEDGNYTVISPGVSAGFQRSYTPVIDIAPTTGKATQLIPAFASSIDGYLKSSANPMFTLAPGEMIDLSMIVWLEGTDADCTDAIYAGKGIQLDLYFSTTNKERDIDNVPQYTFRFYDKTREIWTSDRLTNSAGVSVSPVMQLYDATDKRGYLMHAASVSNVYSESESKYKDKIDLWECKAPSTIISHDLFFRRVDPYNEDEVWNYWHPSVTASVVFNDAKSVVSDTTYINFTAFADGAPASSTTDSAGIPGNTTVLSAANTASTPATSCGGLWGTYECKLLSVIDGTDDRWLANDNAILTLRYIYSYPNTGQTQQIEYVSSGYTTKPYGICYFVVPTTLLNNPSRCSSYTVHRFWGFNKSYAMNIYERNKNMNFNTSCSPQTNTALTGYYMWLSNTPGSSTVNQHWFGSSLSYVNLSTKDEGNNNDIVNNCVFKAHVWGGGTTPQDICLYEEHEYFRINSKFMGYIFVAPTACTSIMFQRLSSFSGTQYNKTYDMTALQSERNYCVYAWDTGEYMKCSHNNDMLSSWPTIPSYWYKWD